MVGLFKKQPAKDPTARRKLKDFEDEGAPEPEEEEAREEADGGSRAGGDVHHRLDRLEYKLGKLDPAIKNLRNEAAQIRERLDQFEQDIERLMPVQGPATAEFTPFSEDSESDAPPIATTGEYDQEIPLPTDLDMDGDLPEFRPFKDGEPEEIEFVVRRRPPEPREVPAPKVVEKPPVTVERAQKKPSLPQVERTLQEMELRHVVETPAQARIAQTPILTFIPKDYLSLVLLMRWVEFLFERVTRDKMSLVLDYYVEVGWISEDVKSEVMSYARGEMQDVTKYMVPEETREEIFREVPATEAAPYKKVEDWRLSADDHLKSLLFIQKIAGFEINKDRLNSLEHNIARFKESLEGFHGV